MISAPPKPACWAGSIRKCTANRLRRRPSLKNLTLPHVPEFHPDRECSLTLVGGAMGEGLRHYVPLRPALDHIVTDRCRGPQGLRMSGRCCH